LFGVVTTEVQNRGYIYLVGIVYGSTAVGLLQAPRILFMPFLLIVTAWARVRRTELAQLFTATNYKSGIDLLVKEGGYMIFLYCLYLIILFFAWPLLETALYSEEYKGIALVAVLFAASSLIGIGNNVAATGLQALNEFRLLSYISLAGAIVTIGLLLLLIQQEDPRILLLATLIGSIVALFIGVFVFRSKVVQLTGVSWHKAKDDG
jgi:O-antigen/teichoic acid export membrane protein